MQEDYIYNFAGNRQRDYSITGEPNQVFVSKPRAVAIDSKDNV